MAEKSTGRKKIPPKPQVRPEQQQRGQGKLPPAGHSPQDAGNPVLNGKRKLHEEVTKAGNKREKASDHVKRKVHVVPDPPAPDPILLTLVGHFLMDFGFNSTSRVFIDERHTRCTLKGWKEATVDQIDKKTPKLEQIFKNWHADLLSKPWDDETSSSETSDDTSSDAESETEMKAGPSVREIAKRKRLNDKLKSASQPTAQETMKTEKSLSQYETKPVAEKKRIMLQVLSKSSTSSSSSESDTDDERAKFQSRKAEQTIQKVKPPAAAKSTLGDKINKLKRKAPSSSTDSASDDSADERSVKVKKQKTKGSAAAPALPAKLPRAAKVTTKAVLTPILSGEGLPSKAIATAASSSEESTDSTSDSDLDENPASTLVVDAKTNSSDSDSDSASASESDSDSDSTSSRQIEDAELIALLSLPKLPTASSDSSATISGDSQQQPTSQHSRATSALKAGNPNTTAAAQQAEPKLKPKAAKATTLAEARARKATPTALAAAGADLGEGHPSNKYQSYSYADRAYKDLSATRGKGFTKEKNKKKRGSYRGGAIDTSAGKSFKFED